MRPRLHRVPYGSESTSFLVCLARAGGGEALTTFYMSGNAETPVRGWQWAGDMLACDLVEIIQRTLLWRGA